MATTYKKIFKDDITLTCRVERKEVRQLTKIALSLGLTRSVYLRLLIEQNNRTPLQIGVRHVVGASA